MSKPFEVIVLVGSLRAASLTRKMAVALIENAPAGLRGRIIDIHDLPVYNEDLEGQVPDAWARLRRDVTAADAVLLATPEYNRSVPACLKNALDVASRPSGQNLWKGKPTGVVSVTPYKLGAFGANHHLRQSCVFLDMPVMQQPEAYIGGAGELFDDAGKLKNDDTRRFLANFMIAFERWVTTLRGDRANGSGSAADDFTEFMKQRDTIAAAYSSGNATPLLGIAAEEGTVTFFPPSGDVISGAKEVTTKYATDAKVFAPDTTNSLEVLDSGASGTLAFWTGLQHFEGKVRGQHAKLELRVTEVFRATEGKWRLVHRHADALTPEMP